MSRVAVSVVLSTHNRCELLGSALESLLDQQPGTPEYEIIVVDNRSTDDTPAVVEKYLRRSARLRYVYEERLGLSYGYNTGIAHAGAPLIAFTDDDIVVACDWIANVKATFDAHPEADFVGGRVLPLWPSTPPAWLDRRHWTPLALQDLDTPYYSNKSTRRGVLGKCFRRDVFDRVGLFAPDLGRTADSVGSLEDRDLITRVWNRGRQGIHAPNLVMYAKVQPERLSKSYHRVWHSAHGRFYAKMRDQDFEQSSWRCLGVPVHVYRALVVELAKWTAASVMRPEADAFEHETRVRFLSGFIRQRCRDTIWNSRAKRPEAQQTQPRGAAVDSIVGS